jgi:hypothetical protein
MHKFPYPREKITNLRQRRDEADHKVRILLCAPETNGAAEIDPSIDSARIFGDSGQWVGS